jgi:hypothetical protein
MSRIARTSLVVAAALIALLAGASGASANSFITTFQDYKADGKINGCAYSEAVLRDAQGQVPPDIEQYAPDFPAALGAALEQRASGGCGKQQPVITAPTATTPAAPTPTVRKRVVKPPPAPLAAPSPLDHAIPRAAVHTRESGASDIPAPLVALGGFGGFLMLGGLGFGLMRWRAWEPSWLLGARHACAEAGYRAGGTWGEFTDWVRLGR